MTEAHPILKQPDARHTAMSSLNSHPKCPALWADCRHTTKNVLESGFLLALPELACQLRVHRPSFSVPGFPGFCSPARLEAPRAGNQELMRGRDSEVVFVILKFHCGSGVEQLAGGYSQSLTNEKPVH